MEFNPLYNQYSQVVSSYRNQDAVTQRSGGVRRGSEPDHRPGSGRIQDDPAGRSPAAIEDKVSLSLEAEEIKKMEEARKMAVRDREVAAHEVAHAAVGGPYAGHPTYTYDQGPDGKRYRVGGEVQMDVAPVPGDPAATLKKANTIRVAALAPSDPSAADRSIAANAAKMATQARTDMLHESTKELQEVTEKMESLETVQEAARGIEAVQSEAVKANSGTRVESGQLLDIMG